LTRTPRQSMRAFVNYRNNVANKHFAKNKNTPEDFSPGGF
jgi:hypothetical protein